VLAVVLTTYLFREIILGLSTESSSNRSSPHPGDGVCHAVSEETRRLFRCGEAAEAIRIIDELGQAGFTAFLAGGCVRDALLGRIPKDYDVATDATPNSIREVFGNRNTLAFGASFGVIGVLPKKKKSKQEAKTKTITPTEVATFRSDGTYSDGRRPDSIHFGTAKQDALRRDFTINGMFYDPAHGCVIDYVGGLDDLRKKRLHTIGNAHQRFDEDKLRMLRAVRFATTIGFELTEETRQAIVQHADTISVVSGERIGVEMRRILTSPNAIEGIELLANLDLSRFVFPEWQEADQSFAKSLLANLGSHSVSTVLACLLLTFRSPSLAAIVSRWKMSGEEQREIHAAVQQHRIIIDAANLLWSQVQPILIERDVFVVIEVAETVAKALNEDLAGVKLAREALTWESARLDPAPLLTGNDLAELGYEPGPLFAKILRSVRTAQLDGYAATREDAKRIAKSIAATQ
jgi:tRNA nucleotidyltransferase (CCA-adding enzyme)